MELILRYVHGFGRSDLDWMEQGPMPQPQPCCSCIARTPCLPTLKTFGVHCLLSCPVQKDVSVCLPLWTWSWQAGLILQRGQPPTLLCQSPPHSRAGLAGLAGWLVTTGTHTQSGTGKGGRALDSFRSSADWYLR